ncbi:hypothetical protein C8Q78DRAFT_802898 [Trametes maxima]|nr:hypothetical protein C8Q78DRAFT_802898 [Trametes maxima]
MSFDHPTTPSVVPGADWARKDLPRERQSGEAMSYEAAIEHKQTLLATRRADRPRTRLRVSPQTHKPALLCVHSSCQHPAARARPAARDKWPVSAETSWELLGVHWHPREIRSPGGRSGITSLGVPNRINGEARYTPVPRLPDVGPTASAQKHVWGCTHPADFTELTTRLLFPSLALLSFLPSDFTAGPRNARIFSPRPKILRRPGAAVPLDHTAQLERGPRLASASLVSRRRRRASHVAAESGWPAEFVGRTLSTVYCRRSPSEIASGVSSLAQPAAACRWSLPKLLGARRFATDNIQDREPCRERRGGNISEANAPQPAPRPREGRGVEEDTSIESAAGAMGVYNEAVYEKLPRVLTIRSSHAHRLRE